MEKTISQFSSKITFKNKGNQLILKNPPNTSRIKQLTELYPNAKFIFLMRNPYEIYSSTVLLFNSLLPIFSLQKWEMQKIEQKILENFILIMDIYEESKKILRENQLIELSYERMLEEPLHELEKIYRKLELDNFQQSRDEFQKYILSQRNFVSNVLDISSGIITLVNSNWEKYIIKYGYKKL